MSKGLTKSLSRSGVVGSGYSRVSMKINTTVTVAAAGALAAFGTVVIGDLPKGLICINGATAKLTFTTADTDLTTTWNGDFSIGSAPNADVTLSLLEIDIIPSTSVGPATARVATARGTQPAIVYVDNADDSSELNLQLLVDAADFTDAGSAIVAVTGTVDFFYAVIGA